MAKETKTGKKDIREEKKTKVMKKPQRKRTAYFKGVWAELKKVHWPNRKELGTYTMVVVAAIFCSAVAIWLADTAITAIFRILT